MSHPRGPDLSRSVEAAERVAAASETIGFLAQDGRAPTREALLFEMGYSADGTELPGIEGPDDPANDPHTAARRALGLEGEQ